MFATGQQAKYNSKVVTIDDVIQYKNKYGKLYTQYAVIDYNGNEYVLDEYELEEVRENGEEFYC